MKSSNNTEIERKFIVNYLPENHGEGTRIKQGYLSCEGEVTTRIRTGGNKAWITIKGMTYGLTRSEYEYKIPLCDAEKMLEMFCPQKIEKTRYLIRYEEHIWEVDVFEGQNKGLIIAEIELNSEDEEFSTPNWVGDEVSHDARFRNSRMIKYPWPFK